MKYIFIAIVALFTTTMYGQSSVLVEEKDSVITAYHLKHHLSADHKQPLGLDTISIFRMYFMRGDEKIILSEKYVNKTKNSKCYWGYYDEEIDCGRFLDFY